MQLAVVNYRWLAVANHFLSNKNEVSIMNLWDGQVGTEYTVRGIVTDDEGLNSFLFSLGCYSGEPITVISRRRSGCTVSIKDARYSIDRQLAKAIII